MESKFAQFLLALWEGGNAAIEFAILAKFALPAFSFRFPFRSHSAAMWHAYCGSNNGSGIGSHC